MEALERYYAEARDNAYTTAHVLVQEIGKDEPNVAIIASCVGILSAFVGQRKTYLWAKRNLDEPLCGLTT